MHFTFSNIIFSYFFFNFHRSSYGFIYYIHCLRNLLLIILLEGFLLLKLILVEKHILLFIFRLPFTFYKIFIFYFGFKIFFIV
mmetsp:Transcript_8901/g.782  ORF Transcript_8901/g.782 Transcript_8901/m.782 type:complete len:83 (-) Transcript_8901:373-621(-)